MTRSILSPHRPEVAKKVFRANAKAQGVTFKEAVEARNLLPKEKTKISLRRHQLHLEWGAVPMGGHRATVWNGTAYMDLGEYGDIDSVCVPDDEVEPGTVRQKEVLNADGQVPTTPFLPSLLDVAKPAKAKGIAKDFEVLESVKKVIALNDDRFEEKHDEFEWEDEWEAVYGEERAQEAKPSYSAVVKGEEKG